MLKKCFIIAGALSLPSSARAVEQSTMFKEALKRPPQPNAEKLERMTHAQLRRAEEQWTELRESENTGTPQDQGEADRRKMWAFPWDPIREWTFDYDDPYKTVLADSSEDYDKWQQAYRMLGGYIDCDHTKSSGNSNSYSYNKYAKATKKGCSRWMMWAAYVDPTYEGRGYYEYNSNYGNKTLDCGQDGSNWKLLGVYRQEFYQFLEQINRHLWSINDSRYIISSAGLSYMTNSDCTLLGWANGTAYYGAVQPLKNGYFQMGVYLDKMCIKLNPYNNVTYDTWDMTTSFDLDEDEFPGWDEEEVEDDNTDDTNDDAGDDAAADDAGADDAVADDAAAYNDYYAAANLDDAWGDDGSHYGDDNNRRKLNGRRKLGDDDWSDDDWGDDSPYAANASYYNSTDDTYSYYSGYRDMYASEVYAINTAATLWKAAQEYTLFSMNMVFDDFKSCKLCMNYPSYQEGYFNGDSGTDDDDLLNQCWKFYSHNSYTCEADCISLGNAQESIVSLAYSYNMTFGQKQSDIERVQEYYENKTSFVALQEERDNLLSTLYVLLSAALFFASAIVYCCLGGCQANLMEDFCENGPCGGTDPYAEEMESGTDTAHDPWYSSASSTLTAERVKKGPISIRDRMSSGRTRGRSNTRRNQGAVLTTDESSNDSPFLETTDQYSTGTSAHPDMTSDESTSPSEGPSDSQGDGPSEGGYYSKDGKRGYYSPPMYEYR